MVSLETNLPFVIFYSYILARYLCVIPIYELLILSPTHSLDLSLNTSDSHCSGPNSDIIRLTNNCPLGNAMSEMACC